VWGGSERGTRRYHFCLKGVNLGPAVFGGNYIARQSKVVGEQRGGPGFFTHGKVLKGWETGRVPPGGLGWAALKASQPGANGSPGLKNPGKAVRLQWGPTNEKQKGTRVDRNRGIGNGAPRWGVTGGGPWKKRADTCDEGWCREG